MATKFDPRRARPGQRFQTSALVPDPKGSGPLAARKRVAREISIRADDEGVVRPRNADQAALADLFGLPVARGVIAAEADEQDDDEQTGDETSADSGSDATPKED